MWKKWKHRSLALQVVLLFTLLLIIPFMILMGFLGFRYRAYAIRNLGEATQDAMKAVSERISDIMKQEEEATMLVYYNGISEYLEDQAVFEEKKDQIEEVLESVRLSGTGNLSVFLKNSASGEICGSTRYASALEMMEPYEEEIVNAGGKCRWYYLYNLSFKTEECRFVLARSVNSRDRKNVGILYVVMEYSVLTDPIRELSSGFSTRYLTDQEGKILYSSGNEEETPFSMEDVYSLSSGGYCEETGKSGRLLASGKISESGWYCVSTVSLSASVYALNGAFPILVLGVIVYIILLAVMIFMLNRLIYRPLSALQRTMDEYANGEMTIVPADETMRGEFGRLSRHFSRMTVRIHDLMEQYRREEEEKNRQKMNALTGQLTPHFIYNALNTIKWIAVLNHQENIQHLVESLIHIFMNAARADDGKYTLRDEIELVKNYSVIQKARFMNFDLIFDVSEEALSCRIHKFLLQPIVENAIVHGLGRGSLPYTGIEIRAWLDRDLFISITDHGVGFDAEEWRKRTEPEKGHTNIGIHAIEEIIRLEYGEAFGIQIESSSGKGTKVTYRLPVR